MNRAFFGLFFLLSGFVVTASTSFGEFTIPDDAYHMNELENALQEAKEDNWALTFLLTSEETTCPVASKASREAIRILNERSIIVYVNAAKDELSLCPDIVGRAFASREAGRFLPIAVIVNSDGDRVIDIVPFISSGDAYLKRLREADRKIADPPFIDRIRDLL